MLERSCSIIGYREYKRCTPRQLFFDLLKNGVTKV